MSKTDFDVVSIGSSTVDIIVSSSDFKVVETDEFKSGTAICEMYGSKVELDGFNISSGGGATNTSSALSHFGLNTSAITCLGNDTFADLIVDELNTFNVDIDNLKVVEGQTGTSIILLSNEGNRTVLVHRGVSGNIDLNIVKDKNLNTGWVYLTNLGAGFENVKEVLEHLDSKNLNVFWNPGSEELKTCKGTDHLRSVNILSLNLEEASYLCDENMTKTKDILRYFNSEVPVDHILITLGKKGAFYVGNEDVIHVSSVGVSAVNTLGAGDAFGSGYLFGWLKTNNVKSSLEYASKNAASIISKNGAKSGFLESLDDFDDPNFKSVSI